MNIVWFKRDLRLHDHVPLCEAIRSKEPLLFLYCFEPSVQQYADWDVRHWRFVWQSLSEMNAKLSDYNATIHLFHEEVIPVFEKIFQNYNVKTVFSYEETGTQITFQRDINFKKFCQKKGVEWQEFPTNGVIRGLKNRKNWDDNFREMANAPIQNPDLSQLKTISALPTPLRQIALNTSAQARFAFLTLFPDLEQQPNEMQHGGEFYAWRYLRTFINERGRGYSRNMSKPSNSRKSCSRISPYLAWGNLSIRQVYQFTKINLGASPFKRDLNNFISRLYWHCHFIQKFENECRMEFEHINRGIQNTLQQPENEHFIQAWKMGQTGYPLVDACMRCVAATGYLNFRMRALVVSFLTHHLWQPWQAGARYLAQQFLDYEPGIHYPQFQMQAGVTGTNTIRMYNPVKQSQEKDPNGVFIKKWIPELSHVPLEWLHEPWKMTALEQATYRCQLGKDYPLPIVDLKKSGKYARDTLWGLRKLTEVKAEKRRILDRHVAPDRWTKELRDS